jgi:homogentisate phytyltransferase/homogentisate geranylgeranyltransferase
MFAVSHSCAPPTPHTSPAALGLPPRASSGGLGLQAAPRLPPAVPLRWWHQGSKPWGSPISCSAAISKFGGDGDSAVPSRGVLDAAAAKLAAFYQFTRPHTILGTAVSILSVSVLALQGQAWSNSALAALWQALSSALLMNVSIVGLNQCFDVEIDKVNKPYLPLASGEFNMATGVALVVVSALASLAIGGGRGPGGRGRGGLLCAIQPTHPCSACGPCCQLTSSPGRPNPPPPCLPAGASSGSAPLLATLGGSLLLGVLYSADLPLMRWKRFPYLAAACILAVRALMVQLGFYAHMQRVAGTAALQPTRPLLFTVAFMLAFSVVIALFKDIPDVKGDTQAGVRHRAPAPPRLAPHPGAEAPRPRAPAATGPPCMLPVGAAAEAAAAAAASALARRRSTCRGCCGAAPLTAPPPFLLQVRTFSVRLGVDRIFWVCVAVLAAAYAGGVAFGLSSGEPWSRALVGGGHAGLGALLVAQARRVDLRSKQQLVGFYMLIWKFFYAEYLLIPLLR